MMKLACSKKAMGVGYKEYLLMILKRILTVCSFLRLFSQWVNSVATGQFTSCLHANCTRGAIRGGGARGPACISFFG